MTSWRYQRTPLKHRLAHILKAAVVHPTLVRNDAESAPAIRSDLGIDMDGDG
jgi:hypothetical protein